jgi:hypothetical protein
MADVRRARSATLTFDPKDQNMDAIKQVVEKLGGLVDCERCGRIAFLRVDFLGDPAPEFKKAGVISFTREG